MRKFDIVFVLAMGYKNDSNPPHKHSGNSAAKTLVNQECKKHEKAHENQYRRK